MAAVGDDPALDGGPVGAYPFCARVRAYNISETMRPVIRVRREVPDGGITDTHSAGRLRDDHRRVYAPSTDHRIDMLIKERRRLLVLEPRREERGRFAAILELLEVIILY